jgi:hypothetical protein
MQDERVPGPGEESCCLIDVSKAEKAQNQYGIDVGGGGRGHHLKHSI